MPRHLLPLVSALAMATAVVSVPIATQAATVAPERPRQIHVISASSTSVTVGAAKTPHVTRYRAYASTVRSNVYVANISRARASALVSTPRMTVGGFRYTTAPIYYKLQVFNGKRIRWDLGIHVAGLRPSTPTGVRAATPSSGPYLSWSGGAGTGFLVYQATNTALTAHRRVYRLRGHTARLSPYGLVRGWTYYFRVRAVNHGSASTYSSLVSMTVPTRQQGLNVMTYNVLEGNASGVPSWSARRAGVVSLVRRGNPDILAVQEAAAWVGSPQGYKGTRQVDDLRRALGNYTLAYTETSPAHRGYFRTANYILYKTASWSPTLTRGHWDVGSRHWAAYQLLENRTSHARVLAISAHLAAGNGRAADTERQNETNSLIQHATAIAPDVPIVYAGDMNSNANRNHVFDGTGNAMRAAGIVDAENAAQSLSNQRYNSSNLYLRTPPALDQNIDYVFAPAGVAVASRSLLLNLSHGRFVGTIPSDHNPLVARLYISY